MPFGNVSCPVLSYIISLYHLFSLCMLKLHYITLLLCELNFIMFSCSKCLLNTEKKALTMIILNEREKENQRNH